MNGSVNWFNLGIWAIIGICIAWYAIRGWYKDLDYNAMEWRERFPRELTTVLLCIVFGPVAICFSKLLEMPGVIDPIEEPEEEEEWEIAVGIMTHAVILQGEKDTCRSAMQFLMYSKPVTVVDAMQKIQAWANGMSDSYLAMSEIFKPDGKWIATYTFSEGGFTIKAVEEEK